MRQNGRLAITGLLLLGSVAACGGEKPAALPSSAVSGPVEAPPSVIDSTAGDPPGALACARLAAAMTAGTLMTAGVPDEIVAASVDADAPLADAADRLEVAYRAAVDAAGKPDEPDKIAAVAAAASEMSDVCVDSGLRTTG